MGRLAARRSKSLARLNRDRTEKRMPDMSETHFPLDESKLPFSIPKDAQPREKILKLGRMITDRIPAKLHGLTAEGPEYWGLAGVVTDEMADVALKMKVRKPMTLS